jgi:hypothetical protein
MRPTSPVFSSLLTSDVPFICWRRQTSMASAGWSLTTRTVQPGRSASRPNQYAPDFLHTRAGVCSRIRRSHQMDQDAT